MNVTSINPELAHPNVCAICETKPEGARFVDTGLNNNYVPPSPLTGRKYVCELCVKHLATAVGGYASEAELAHERELRTDLQNALLAANERADELQADVVGRLVEAVKASAPKPTPRKRTP